jgi:hypothetical protein
LTAGLVGWRRSADRARLRVKSLLTGNFTGNFAVLGAEGSISVVRNRCAAATYRTFPTQINRENILKNRDFLFDIREI